MNSTKKGGPVSSKSGKKRTTDERKHSPSSEDEDSRRRRTLFFGNLPPEFSKKRFLKLVSQYGEVDRMWIRGIKPKAANIPKKIALIKNLLAENHPPLHVYVLFKTVADAKQALQLSGESFENHRLRVTLSAVKEYDKNKGVFVGNLPLAVGEDEVHDMFSKCGDILCVRLIRDKVDGKGKGFGYVNFQTSDAVELALKLNGEMLNNREIRVKRLQSAKQVKKQNKKIRKKEKVFNNKSTQPSHKKKKKLTKSELKKKFLAKLLVSKKNIRSSS